MKKFPRRKFLMDVATGLPLFFLPSALLSACGTKDSSEPNGKKVVVIGAGISGLAAANKLKANGFEVVVLEAQDRVGGRLRTNRDLGFAFDEGASWIHGVNGNPISSLAQNAGMETIAADDESYVCYDLGGMVRSDSDFSEVEDAFYEVLESLYADGSSDKSFETVFTSLFPASANDRLWRFFLSAYLTFDTGDLNRLSSLLYDAGEVYSGGERIALNGYDQIPNFLANGLEIHLNQQVSEINYTGAEVGVRHNGTETKADYVLVTVPLGVLKANAITFQPALPTAKVRAIENIGMSCVNKFVLTWDTAFWDEKQYLFYTPEEKDAFNFFVNLNIGIPNSNALMTFAYSEYARQTELMTDAELIDAIMNHLKDMYGNGIPNPINFQRTKWQSNPFTFGAYSFTAVETEMRHFEDLAKSVNNQVFFAGEHTEIDYFSTAHGAYLSGLREAEKIIDLQ